ncbi:hypothetical protein [Dongia sp.]|uniref:hypothetical protein n=1 Tax=Dongia sp. TaxID=1977262 RepID=UPI0035B33E9C
MKVRIIRGYYNDREKSVKAGLIKNVTDARGATLIKKGLAVAIEEPKPAGKGQRAGAPSSNKRQTGSQTGAARPVSSSRRGQARSGQGSKTSPTGESGAGSAS